MLGVSSAAVWIPCLLSVAFFCALWGCGLFRDDVKMVWAVCFSLRLGVCVLGADFAAC